MLPSFVTYLQSISSILIPCASPRFSFDGV